MRPAAAIPTASMADIGFLLLTFFLVATAVWSDAGLRTTLPPAGATGAAPARSLLAIAVGPDGRVLADGEILAPEALRARVAAHASSGAGHVALQASRRTPYADYVAALDAVLLGHRDAGVEPRLTLRAPAR